MTEKVYLGFEDESILGKHENDVTCTTNKFGGEPNWPPIYSGESFDSKCLVCCLPRPLVLQCYAPLPESPYHRTLYIYGCINPSCWNNSTSWSCFRSQYIEGQKIEPDSLSPLIEIPAEVETANLDPWCSGADDWGDEDISEGTSESTRFTAKRFISNDGERMSDSDNEPDEMELIEACVGNMILTNDSKSEEFFIGEKEMIGTSAEIDCATSEVVADFSKRPQTDIFALLMQVPEIPVNISKGIADSVAFIPKFIAVEQEYLDNSKSDHVSKLLEQYQKENSDDLTKNDKNNKSNGKSCKNEVEEYEKAIPLHGNEVFHHFLTRVQMNPTQILRYSYGGDPLPMGPLPDDLSKVKCSYCKGDVWFELQILPTIIPSLKIPKSSATHLEFGTVFVYTCKKSCWKNDDKILLETIFVQPEPL